MLVNFLKVAIRLVRRYKAYAFINMTGLAIGMTVSALILLWVVDELSYDRYHEHSQRIHRVGVDFQAGTHMTLVMSMPALAEAARNRVPEVENTARISAALAAHRSSIKNSSSMKTSFVMPTNLCSKFFHSLL